MTAISLKKLDIESGKIDSKSQDFQFQGELKIESQKNLAYAIRWQLAKRRAGTAKVKAMSEISGTTAKPHKQKGTGNARQGSKRSVQFVGGRTCHGPTPRSFDFSIPKKIVKNSLSDALKAKLQENKVILLEKSSANLKTKIINSAFKQNKIKSALILVDFQLEENHSLILAVRNLKNVKALDAKAINAYDILKFDNLIVEEKLFEDKILKSLK